VRFFLDEPGDDAGRDPAGLLTVGLDDDLHGVLLSFVGPVSDRRPGTS
jgi:hypothetical protein